MGIIQTISLFAFTKFFKDEQALAFLYNPEYPEQS